MASVDEDRESRSRSTTSSSSPGIDGSKKQFSLWSSTSPLSDGSGEGAPPPSSLAPIEGEGEGKRGHGRTTSSTFGNTMSNLMRQGSSSAVRMLGSKSVSSTLLDGAGRGLAIHEGFVKKRGKYNRQYRERYLVLYDIKAAVDGKVTPATLVWSAGKGKKEKGLVELGPDTIIEKFGSSSDASSSSSGGDHRAVSAQRKHRRTTTPVNNPGIQGDETKLRVTTKERVLDLLLPSNEALLMWDKTLRRAVLKAVHANSEATGKATTELVDTRWNEWVNLGIKVNDLPRAARIIFTVREGESGSGKPVSWASCSLFTYSQRLRSGIMELPLWSGACPNPSVPRLGGIEAAREGTIRIAFQDLGPEVIYYQERGMYASHPHRYKSFKAGRATNEGRGSVSS